MLVKCRKIPKTRHTKGTELEKSQIAQLENQRTKEKNQIQEEKSKVWCLKHPGQ